MNCKIYADSFIQKSKEVHFENIAKFCVDEKGVEFISKKEIRFKGRMYDILYVKVENGKKVYYAYSDSREDSAAASLAAFAQNNASDKAPLAKVSFEINKFVHPEENYLSIKLFSSQKQPVFYNYLFTYQSPYLKITSPPPKSFAC